MMSVKNVMGGRSLNTTRSSIRRASVQAEKIVADQIVVTTILTKTKGKPFLLKFKIK